MMRIKIFVMLGCLGIVAQARSFGNSNANSNSNVFSRRQNDDVKCRGEIDLHSLMRFVDEESANSEEEDNPTLDEVRRILYLNEDPKIASVASSAARATLAVARTLAREAVTELTETTAVAVAEAVARILSSRDRYKISRRNNINTNTNTNTNIIGGGSVGGAPIVEVSSELPFLDETQGSSDVDTDIADNVEDDIFIANHDGLSLEDEEEEEKERERLEEEEVRGRGRPQVEEARGRPENAEGRERPEEEEGRGRESLEEEDLAGPEEENEEGEGDDEEQDEFLTDARHLRRNTNTNTNSNSNIINRRSLVNRRKIDFKSAQHRNRIANANANANTNVFRRNANVNSNANINSFQKRGSRIKKNK